MIILLLCLSSEQRALKLDTALGITLVSIDDSSLYLMEGGETASALAAGYEAE